MIQDLLNKIDSKEVVFTDVIAFIEDNYNYSPSAFSNGKQLNAETENQGSAKVLYFAQLNNLSKEDTLKLFVEHYQAVLETPEETNHQNIRQFMINGWDGVKFENQVLASK